LGFWAILVFASLLALPTIFLLSGQYVGGGVTLMFVLPVLAYLAAILLPYFTRPGPALVLDREGVEHIWFGRIPWDQVHGIGLTHQDLIRGYTQVFLVLGVREPGCFLERRPNALRLFERAKAREAETGDLLIPLHVLDKSPDRVRNVALDLRGRVSPPRSASWFPGIDPQAFAANSQLSP
jgi:hypothetical protein